MKKWYYLFLVNLGCVIFGADPTYKYLLMAIVCSFHDENYFEEIDNLIKVLENNQQPVGQIMECMFERAIKGKYSKIIKNKIFSNKEWW